MYNCLVKTTPPLQTLDDAEAYLAQFFSSRWTYTLGRMRQLLRDIGDPQLKLAVIHIGGTAGKGSTSQITASILQSAGYKVGLHTSPHLISITERFMINKIPIAPDRFVQLLNALIPAIDHVAQTNPDGAPTYYEITIAMMFQYFWQENVNVAVIEVGLGGKLDATNLVDPCVSVVTNVGLDHMEILGDTVEKIVMDKREIIKAGKPAVSGATQETVRALIIEKAARVDAPLYLLDRDFHIENIRPHEFTRITEGQKDIPILFDYVSGEHTYRDLALSLFGKHQAINAAVAITAVLRSGFSVSEDAIRTALTHIKYLGRLDIETIGTTPVLSDGAHNPMKMAALTQALDDHFPGKTFPTLLAVKGDKNSAEMIATLAPRVSHWFVTTLERQTDWGKRVMYEIPDLVKIIKEVDPTKPITEVPSFPKFLEHMPTGSEPLLITGSLYLVGAVEEWRINQKGI